MEFAPLLVMASLVKKVIDFLKQVSNRKWNDAITTAVAWGGGVLVVWLFAQSDWANGMRVGDQVLGNLNAASLVILGMSIGSFGSILFHDVPQRLDPTVQNVPLALVPKLAAKEVSRPSSRGTRSAA